MSKVSEDIAIVKKEDVEFFINLFKDIDIDLYQLLREARIPNTIKHDDANYQYLPESTIKNLITILGNEVSQTDFAINIWLACKKTYVPRFLAKLDAPTTVHDALSQFCDYLPGVSSAAKVSIQLAGGRWWLTREKAFSHDFWFHYSEIFSVIFMNELLLALVGKEWKAEEVGVQAKSIDDFKALPEMGNAQFYAQRPVTAFSIPDKFMQATVKLPPLEKTASDNALLEQDSTFLSVFKLVIKPYLSMGKLSIKWASEILNLHVRTIQRRLDAEGVTYKKLIEDMVLEETLKLLHNPELTITTIASKMGYSDSAHFTRAFKRQMKMTPKQYRHEYLSQREP